MSYYWARLRSLSVELQPDGSSSATEPLRFTAEGSAAIEGSYVLDFSWKVAARPGTYTAEVALNRQRAAPISGLYQQGEITSDNRLADNALLTWVALDVVGLDHLVRMARIVGESLGQDNVNEAVRLKVQNLGLSTEASVGKAVTPTSGHSRLGEDRSVVVWIFSLVADSNTSRRVTYNCSASKVAEEDLDEVLTREDALVLRIHGEGDEPEGEGDRPATRSQAVSYVVIPLSLLNAYAAEGASVAAKVGHGSAPGESATTP